MLERADIDLKITPPSRTITKIADNVRPDSVILTNNLRFLLLSNQWWTVGNIRNSNADTNFPKVRINRFDFTCISGLGFMIRN